MVWTKHCCKHYVLALLIPILLVGCSLPFGQTTPRATPTATRGLGIHGAIDTISAQVLINMHLHAWNPQAMTKGVVTGGLFINWKMSDPSITNNTRPGATGNTQNDHDPQVDLLYLTALAEYRQLHVQSQMYTGDIGRATALVVADFARYSLPKGWIYFYLLKDGLALNNQTLVDEAHTIAKNYFATWYNPTFGTVYDKVHTPGDYDTNNTLQSGAALIEAGQRWQEPSWVAAGEKTIDHTLSVALDPHYHLLYNSMVIEGGHDRVQNYQAKPSTQGEGVDALLTAYTLTHNQHDLDVANQILQALFGTSGLWDKTNGGFFFALDMSNGKLSTDYKETRSQTLTLISINHFNRIHPLFTLQEQQLVQVLTEHFYQSTYHGFVYRLTSNFQIYVSKPGAGIGFEDFFTTEAMGSTLDALQQTEISA